MEGFLDGLVWKFGNIWKFYGFEGCILILRLPSNESYICVLGICDQLHRS